MLGPKSADTSSDAAAVANLLRIRGVASSNNQVSQFVAKLGKSPLLQGVQLLSGDGGNKNAPRKFEVTAIFAEAVAGK